MPVALIDSNVLFAFRNSSDQYHDRATDIVTAIDAGTLPDGRVPNYTLPEVLNPIVKRGGHAAGIETLDFLTGSRGFRLTYFERDDYDRGQALFRRAEGVELTDATIVAYMRRSDIDYIYSFDDDFDRFDGITRLSTPDDPYAQ